MKDIFNQNTVDELLTRLHILDDKTRPLWGKMDVAQMLAHLNIQYEMVYDDIHKRPPFLVRGALTLLVKQFVTGEKPYKKNGRTSSLFLVKASKDFMIEKERLIHYLKKTQQLGKPYFEGKESFSFGKLSAKEWNNLFYKHIDHHLEQFGV